MKTLTAFLLALVATVAAASCIPEAHATPPGADVAIEVAAQAAALNTAGDHVFASAQVADGTGVTTTVAAAGTYVTVATVAPLAASESDGSGCITYTLASNKFTIAKACGAGTLKLSACLADVIGTNSKTWTGAWHRVRSGSTSIVGPITRRTEGATAARGAQGCADIYVAASTGDTYDFRYDSQTNADTVVTRYASFSALKLKSN